MAITEKKELFKFNPFSGVLEEDLATVIIPKFDVAALCTQIKNTNNLAIEFIGKQGRGKTTHLLYVQQQLPEYPIFLLRSGADVTPILNHPAQKVFVDSIHHLSLKERIQLFKAKETIIYTTHWRRKLTSLLTHKIYKSIRFKGIEVTSLKNILNNRLQFASIKELPVTVLFTDEKVSALIHKFGDNYRGIINYLYEQY